jgi:hypothetical protein
MLTGMGHNFLLNASDQADHQISIKLFTNTRKIKYIQKAASKMTGFRGNFERKCELIAVLMVL